MPWSAIDTSTALNTADSSGLGSRRPTSRNNMSPKLACPMTSADRSSPWTMIRWTVEPRTEVLPTMFTLDSPHRADGRRDLLHRAFCATLTARATGCQALRWYRRDVPRRYSTASRQAQTSATQRRILEAVEELVLEAGPDRVTLKAVSDRSGVALATLYKHFESRTELLAGAHRTLAGEIDAFLEELAVAAAAPGQPREQLRSLLTRCYDALDKGGARLARIPTILGVPEIETAQARAAKRRRAHLLGQLEQFFDVVDLGDFSVDHAHDVAAADVDRVAAGGESEGVSGVGRRHPPVEDDPAARKLLLEQDPVLRAGESVTDRG